MSGRLRHVSICLRSVPISGTYTADASEALIATLQVAAPGGVRARAIDRLAYAQDASHYRVVPGAVVEPRDASQLAAVVAAAAADGTPVTFRAGGTSLSGQAVGSGVVIDIRRHFRGLDVLDDGRRVRVQPGVTLRQVNARLAVHGRRLGPDPASEVACTIGGVVANNSSGMTCGTHANAYRTLDSLVLVLPSGTLVDTGAADADERLRQLEPALYEGLIRLRDRIRGSVDSRRRIAHQYAIKNTMGYSLNAFVDRDAPARILEGLAVGSEGTLAFIAEATFRTVPLATHAATSLLLFDDLARANAALPALVEAELAAIELLDAASLRVAQADPGSPATLHEIDVARHAGLLIEHQETSAERLAERVARTDELLGRIVPGGAALTSDRAARASLWRIRKGLYAAVAGARTPGTTAVLEDVAVPVPHLAEVCRRLGQLFATHGYDRSVIFGHAKDGNVHFMLEERFDRPERMDAYERFTDDMVELVLAHDGTLKAEHGTGRIMAPFVRRQFGDELYDVMCEVKRLCDPGDALNPGVVINADPRAHLRDVKPSVVVEPEVDRCVSCGFCEPVCPSKDLTTTPRQRILLRREQVAAESRGDHALAETLGAEYVYDGLETCAVDGMCQTACPVGINTGDLVRRFRAERTGAASARGWTAAARHWDGTTRALAGGLRLAHGMPPAVPRAASSVARRLLGDEVVPTWDRDVPSGGAVRRPRSAVAPDVVFLPSCTGTLFEPAAGGEGATEAFLRLCDRAGVTVRVPDAIASMCCGTPWKSKGHMAGYERMRAVVEGGLGADGASPSVPLVTDASSCAEGLRDLVGGGRPIVDAVTFTADVLLARLPTPRRLDHVVVHPTCSTMRAGGPDALLVVAGAVARRVTVPTEWSCCAFAGDRGLLHPELTASATHEYATAVRAVAADAFVSSNRTCELGMTRATSRPYRHVLELLEEATRVVGDLRGGRA